MSDNVTPIELSEQDQADLDQLAADGQLPSFHPVLEVWRAVLEPIEEQRATAPAPVWCQKIMQAYPEIRYRDMGEFHERYFDKLSELRDILEAEIAEDEECFNYTSPEEDAAENSVHYKNLILTWQQAILQWELDWSHADENAAVEIAAIGEAQRMFFGQNGITAYLDNIKFEFTEDDQQMLADALNEQREAAQ